MICPTCGREVPDDQNFCDLCGAILPKPKRRRRWILPLLLGILALALVLGAFFGPGAGGMPSAVPAVSTQAQVPSAEPAAKPAPKPTAEPTPEPSPEPTPEPTVAPYVEPTNERGGMWDLVPFDQMPYERPSLDGLDAAIEAVGEALDRGAPYEELELLLDACDDEYNAFYTMYSIAFIRSCQDTTDQFYADEYAALDEASADLSQKMETLYYRCGMSDRAQELEEKYFWPGFAEEYADDSNAFYDDEMVALLQTESNLVTEYRDLVANPIVTLKDGTEVEYATAIEEYAGIAYLNLLFAYYEQYNPKLAPVYIDLIKNRQQQAVQAGYASYEELAFDHSFERDYTPELAQEYLQGIKTHLVPLYRELASSGALYSIDRGSIDAARLEEVLRCGVADLGEEVQDTYEFMVKYRLCDLEYSPRKAEMSFQTYLGAYEVPFLFMDAGGDLGDITTFSHEFGHYLDGFLNYDEDETIDLAECFSQSMELLMLTRLDGVLSDRELDALYRLKMADILSMYVQQAAFAEFEHIIYSTDPDKLTPDYVNGVFLQMCQDYGFCEQGFEDLYAMLWQDITHFYEQPFYVITYPVSNDIAMQIFQLEEESPGAGREKFLEMLPREYPDMLDSALNAGLESPFDPGRLEKVADTMRRILLDDSASGKAA